MATMFQFGEHKDYQPYDGDGAAALLPFDGYVALQLTRGRIEMTKDNSKSIAKFTFKVNEEDLAASTIYGQALLDGTDRKGNPLGKQFLDFLTSAGVMSASEITAAAAGNESRDADSLVQQVINDKLTVFAEVRAETYNNKTTSKVANFVTKDYYDRQVTGGTHRNYRQNNAGAAAPTAASNGGSAASTLLTNVL